MKEDELIAYLSERRFKGRINIPCESIQLENPQLYELRSNNESATFVKDEEKDEVKRFMLHNFYPNAPLPKTTRCFINSDKFKNKKV